MILQQACSPEWWGVAEKQLEVEKPGKKCTGREEGTPSRDMVFPAGMAKGAAVGQQRGWVHTAEREHRRQRLDWRGQGREAGLGHLELKHLG